MRILHLNNEKTWRGGERQTLLLAKALAEFGVGSAIGCRPGAALEDHARRERLPTFAIAGNGVRAAFDLARIAKGFDLIHCHTGRTHSLAAATAVWHGKPIVVTRRVAFLPKPSWFNRRKYRTASKVVCVSNYVASQLGHLPIQPAR